MFFFDIIHLIRSRLAGKLIFVVVILLSTISILLTSFFIMRQKKLLTEELYNRTQSLAQNLTYNSRNHLFSEDNSTIQSLVSGVKEERDIENVFLTDSEGKILAHTNPAYIGETFIIPANIDPTNRKNWFPTNTTSLQRMIVPIEIDVPIVDNDSTLFSPTNGKISYYDRALEFTFPRFTHDSNEVTFTLILRKVGKEVFRVRSILSVSIENRTLHHLVEQASHGYWSHSGRYLTFTSVDQTGHGFWSRSGRYITCTPTESEILSILDTETDTAKNISRDELIGIKCFTPDDRYIINTMLTEDMKQRLFRIPREGGEPEQLTFHDGLHWHPECSPDGKWIMYTEVGLFYRLYLYNTETKKSSLIFPESRETPDLLGKQRCGSFSPDGSKICYLRRMDPTIDWELFVVGFNDGKVHTNDTNYGTQLTFNGGFKKHTDWSPDGKWITYRQGEVETSGGDIWIVPSEGGDPINLTGSLKTNRIMAGYAVLDVSIESLNKKIAHGNRYAILITLIMVGVGIIVTIFLIRGIVHPVKYLADATGKVAHGDFDQKVSINKTDEIGSLTEAFNRMTQNLKQSQEKLQSQNLKLQKANKELESLDKAKDDFLSLVSHELRTPLSSILLGSQMLLRGQVDSEEKKTAYIATIVEDSIRLTRLINDVLDLSKIEAGCMTFTIESLNIRELVDDVSHHFLPEFRRKNLHFDYGQIPEDAFLRGDRDKIIQVMTNILSNAVKFTPDSGSIIISLRCSDGTGTIAVKDTGEGIRKEDIPKVFDRFYQLASINHHSEGTGLGMTITKSIVEHLGGTIWIESEHDKGTTVFFTLPLAEERPDHARVTGGDMQTAVVKSETASLEPDQKKILIIDDEKAIRMALTDCFQKEGFDTFEASNGNEALHIVDTQQPELIILDVMMPGISGIEVCRDLRDDPKTRGIKIIMLSARGQEKEKEEGLKAGADRYITKPFDYVELMKVVEELLGIEK